MALPDMRIGDIVVTISPIRMSGQAMAHWYHSYYTISANLIYMDPDYNSPLYLLMGLL